MRVYLYIQRYLHLSFMLILLCGCTNNGGQPATLTATAPDATHPANVDSIWNIYDPNPEHLWNRVFRQFYRRISTDGMEYGAAELDPLLWFDTTYLLNGVSHQQSLQVLDEFLTTHAENFIQDPLKHAMFQRDLWAVFDWLTSQAEPHPVQRQALATRLAKMIRSVALSKAEIATLPDNYTLTIESKTLPTLFQIDQPEKAFLPADIFDQNSAWVPLGREGGPVAMTHTAAFPFFGRSVFFVFVRSPNGRMATLDFIEALRTEPNPTVAIGSEVALVRRMLLIDDQGELVLSPLIETVQLRHFSPAQNFYEFELSRQRLFDGQMDSLVSKTDIFLLFMSHGDVFESAHGPELQAAIPEICKACHFENPPLPDSGNTRSIISYSRSPFSLPDHTKPILFATTLEAEAQTVMEWKHDHATWKSLETLWHPANP